jgi:hypothetical protein
MLGCRPPTGPAPSHKLSIYIFPGQLKSLAPFVVFCFNSFCFPHELLSGPPHLTGISKIKLASESFAAWACGNTGAPKRSLRRTRGQEKPRKPLKFLLSCSMVFSAPGSLSRFLLLRSRHCVTLIRLLHAASTILYKARKVTLESGTAICSLRPRYLSLFSPSHLNHLMGL